MVVLSAFTVGCRGKACAAAPACQPPTTSTTLAAPAPGFTNFTGTAISAHLAPTTIDSAALPSYPAPIHVELLVRGAASADLSGVTVDGHRASIAWPGGTPITITGIHATITTPVAVDLNGNGVLVHLDGAQLQLGHGDWRIDGPVAVGTSGLAAPRDAVRFEVPDAGAVMTFHGGAGVRLPAVRQVFEGPGALSLDGRFTARTSSAQRSVAHLRTSSSPYRITVEWRNGAIAVDGTVQGAVQ